MGLSICLFGGFSVAFDRQPLTIRNRKAKVLLAYVALSRNLSQTREQLSGLLWGDFSESHARASLRQTVRTLRQIFDKAGATGFVVDRGELCLDPNDLDVDVLSALKRLRTGDVPPSLLDEKDISDTLLAGFDDVDQAVSSWLIVQRQNLRDRLVNALEAQLKGSEPITDSQLNTTKSAAVALANLDPTHEGAARRLMTIAALDGDVSVALRRYQNLWGVLDTEHGMEPSDETQELVARIKSGAALRPSRSSEPDSDVPIKSDSIESGEYTQKLRIVVNAFEREGIDESRQYVVSGFRQELISALVRFNEWSVIDGARAESDLIEEKRDLSVYVLDAASYEASGNIQLAVTLRGRDSGEYIWSDDYSAALADWFASQRMIVRKIAIALNVHVSAARIAGIVGEPDVSLPLHDRWLWGQNLSKRWRADPETKAADIFRSIIKEAPDFVPAYCSLVNYANSRHLIYPGTFRDHEEEHKTLALAKTAIEIGPTVPAAQLCAGWSHALNWQFDQAEFRYQMAYDLNPNDPWTIISSSLGLAFCGQYETSRSRADQAIELGLSVERLHWGYQAVIRFMYSDYAGCDLAAERAEDVIYNILAWRAAALSHLGRNQNASKQLERYVQLVMNDWHGASAPSEDFVARWLLHAFPIRHQSDWLRLRDGLRNAGGNAFDIEDRKY